MRIVVAGELAVQKRSRGRPVLYVLLRSFRAYQTGFENRAGSINEFARARWIVVDVVFKMGACTGRLGACLSKS